MREKKQQQTKMKSFNHICNETIAVMVLSFSFHKFFLWIHIEMAPQSLRHILFNTDAIYQIHWSKLLIKTIFISLLTRKCIKKTRQTWRSLEFGFHQASSSLLPSIHVNLNIMIWGKMKKKKLKSLQLIRWLDAVTPFFGICLFEVNDNVTI